MTTETTMTMAFPASFKPELDDKLNKLADSISNFLEVHHNIHDRKYWVTSNRSGERVYRFKYLEIDIHEFTEGEIINYNIEKLLSQVKSSFRVGEYLIA